MQMAHPAWTIAGRVACAAAAAVARAGGALTGRVGMIIGSGTGALTGRVGVIGSGTGTSGITGVDGWGLGAGGLGEGDLGAGGLGEGGGGNGEGSTTGGSCRRQLAGSWRVRLLRLRQTPGQCAAASSEPAHCSRPWNAHGTQGCTGAGWALTAHRSLGHLPAGAGAGASPGAGSEASRGAQRSHRAPTQMPAAAMQRRAGLRLVRGGRGLLAEGGDRWLSAGSRQRAVPPWSPKHIWAGMVHLLAAITCSRCSRSWPSAGPHLLQGGALLSRRLGAVDAPALESVQVAALAGGDARHHRADGLARGDAAALGGAELQVCSRQAGLGMSAAARAGADAAAAVHRGLSTGRGSRLVCQASVQPSDSGQDRGCPAAQ